MKSSFLRAEWRKLAIANYSVDPDLLKPYLPYKTELDYWNGKCYLSLVGFRFLNTRLNGIAIPFHRHFEEVNLRFYVRYKDLSGWRRGVTFIREIVPKNDTTKLFKDCSRLLTIGGVLYFSTIKGDYHNSGYEAASTGDKTYFYYYDEAYLKEQLMENNFALLDVQYKHFPKANQNPSVDMIFIAKKI